ncbi:MAG TPA: peptidoglycan-binding protein, partial [Rhodobacteraceae bacterium]|nr:peptidoglycan-binding protein [Paracoccaceae bacterium]
IAAGALRAQSEDVVFVQIEAQPTLAQAQTAARNYAAKLDDVNGFDIGGGWYAVALGPYRRIDAEQVLRAFRAEGSIPRDSFVALPGTYRQQFWPIGGAALAPAVTSQPVVPAATPEP